MQGYSKFRIHRGTAALTAAVAAVSLVPVARATTFSSTISSVSQVEPSTSPEMANNQSEVYSNTPGPFELNGSAYKFKDWGIVQFAAPVLPGGTQVSSVNPDLTLQMDNDLSSFDSTTNITLSFYLTTDTSTSVAGSSSPAGVGSPSPPS